MIFYWKIATRLKNPLQVRPSESVIWDKLFSYCSIPSHIHGVPASCLNGFMCKFNGPLLRISPEWVGVEP